MNPKLTRRSFAKSLLAGVAGLSLPSLPAWAVAREPFAFVLLGDLHFDKLQHHDLEWLGKTKPDDLRQVHEYSTLSSTIQPRLFEAVQKTIAESGRAETPKVAFTAQLGDLVEGLCGSGERALRQDTDALEMIKQARLGVPFLFTKGNHDVTGAGALEAFNAVFHPFLNEQRQTLGSAEKLTSTCYAYEQGEALFCFFDAYDKASLSWLEATLERRTARHCFLLLHPPVVPYGARATWHLFSSDREKTQREHLLELLGKHNAFVLSGHIHKHNLLVRTTPNGGRFVQLGLCSVIPAAEVSANHELSGVNSYNPNQVSVEPHFSPGTEQQRRAVYQVEAPFVKRFEYADLPGYAVIAVEGPKVTARIYSGVGRQVWRTLPLSDFLAA